jgi:hypothetical protein
MVNKCEGSRFYLLRQITGNINLLNLKVMNLYVKQMQTFLIDSITSDFAA